MKQLKVIVNDTASQLISQNGGYVTANFVNPVEIKKNSLICLDKFNATSKNISQNFSTVQQTFRVQVSAQESPLGLLYADVTVPGGTYATIKDYMRTINEVANATAISAYRPLEAGVYDISSWENTFSQLSMALTLAPTGTGGVFSQWFVKTYGLSPLSSTSTPFWTPSENLGTDVDGLHYSTDANPATLTAANQAMKGGGIASTAILVPATDNLTAWTWGFTTTTGDLGATILQKNGSSNLWVRNNSGTQTQIANSAALFPGAYANTGFPRFTIIQRGGIWGFTYCDDTSDDEAPVTVYCVAGAPYAGAMGAYNYSTTYTLGVTLEPGANTIGSVNYTPNVGGVTDAPCPQSTNTTLDLTLANQLALTLGFSPQIYLLTPLLGSFFSVLTSAIPFDINQLRSAFELAIEIIDVPLKTYFAQTGNNAHNYGRQNVICYFTPTPSNEAEGLYSFANPVHQWLSIDNLADTTLHSLSFRVYNPYNNQSFVSNSMGFNLLIRDPVEDTMNTS